MLRFVQASTDMMHFKERMIFKSHLFVLCCVILKIRLGHMPESMLRRFTRRVCFVEAVDEGQVIKTFPHLSALPTASPQGEALIGFYNYKGRKYSAHMPFKKD